MTVAVGQLVAHSARCCPRSQTSTPPSGRPVTGWNPIATASIEPRAVQGPSSPPSPTQKRAVSTPGATGPCHIWLAARRTRRRGRTPRTNRPVGGFGGKPRPHGCRTGRRPHPTCTTGDRPRPRPSARRACPDNRSAARSLADKALADQAAWIQALGPAPAASGQREAWTRAVAIVAAYRERWGIAGDLRPLGPPTAPSVEADRQRRLALAAIRQVSKVNVDHWHRQRECGPFILPLDAVSHDGLEQ